MYPFLFLAGWVLVAESPAEAPVPSPPLLSHPGLQALLARSQSPALRAAQARQEGASHALPQAGALPDPDLSFSIQRIPGQDVMIEGGPMDGPPLTGMIPNRTEFGLMAGQVLPWPGKRAARMEVARQGHARATVAVQSARLQQEGEILDLFLERLALRGRQNLLLEQDRHWQAAEGITQAALASGRGSTADLLQVQQERIRLRQRQSALAVRDLDLQDALARAAGLEPGAPLEVTGSLGDFPLPQAPAAEALRADLEARNPEWAAARTDESAAQAALRLANLERRPDLRVGLGLMAERGMAPGWKAEVGLAVPLQRAKRQDRVVAQRRADVLEAQSGRNGLRLLVAQRARERARAWALGLQTATTLRRELLPADEATLETVLGDLSTGRSGLSRVLDALNRLLKDREDLLALETGLHRLSLQQHRASLEAPPAFELGMAPPPLSSPTPSAAAPSSRSAAPAGPMEGTPVPMKM